jgi:hypothetical protein
VAKEIFCLRRETDEACPFYSAEKYAFFTPIARAAKEHKTEQKVVGVDRQQQRIFQSQLSF